MAMRPTAIGSAEGVFRSPAQNGFSLGYSASIETITGNTAGGN